MFSKSVLTCKSWSDVNSDLQELIWSQFWHARVCMHTKFGTYEGLTLIEIRSRYKSESGRGSAVFGPFFVQNFRHDCLAQNASFADLGAPKACQSVALSVKLTKTRHSGRMFGRKMARKRPKRGLEDKNWPKQEILSGIIFTLRLTRNGPFAHLGAPRACQSVVLSVHMAKTRHSGRMFGRKTARKWPVTRPN